MQAALMREHGYQFSREFMGYFLASLAALLLDAAILLVLAQVVHYLIAATLGFTAGALLNFILSTRFVFARRKWMDKRWQEIVIFVSIGIFGVLLNNGVIYCAVEMVGAQLLLAKLLAAGATFLFNFGLRKILLF